MDGYKLACMAEQNRSNKKQVLYREDNNLKIKLTMDRKMKNPVGGKLFSLKQDNIW